MSRSPVGLFLIIGLMTILNACGGPGVAEDATGAEIYVQLCARCHGRHLTGGTGVALVGDDARSIDKPERYFVQSINAGLGRMPSFRGTLTEDQILRVSRYIIEQQGR